VVDKTLGKDVEPEDPEEEPGDTSRQAWELGKRLFKPDNKKTEPEHLPKKPDKKEQAIDKKVETEKQKKYAQQRDILKSLKQQSELEKISKELDNKQKTDKYAEPEEPEEQEVDLPDKLEKDEAYSTEDFYYSPDTGFVWDTPASFKKWNSPELFGKLSNCYSKPFSAVYSINENKILLGSNVHEIIQEARWTYEDTVWMEINGGDLVIRSDNDDASVAIREAVDSGVVQLLIESTKRPRQIIRG